MYEIWIKKTDDVGSQWVTEGGYDSLYHTTLASMQGEIDSLKAELTRYKVLCVPDVSVCGILDQ